MRTYRLRLLFRCGRRLRRKLQHCRHLTFVERCQQNDLSIGKLERIMMDATLVRVNLPEYRHPVVHFCPLPPKEATRPEAHHFLRKYEFCSWKNADCCCAVFWSRKFSRAGIEVVGHKFVADLCRTRFGAVQAVVAHVAISASIPLNCLEKWRKISRYAVSSHSCQHSHLTARAARAGCRAVRDSTLCSHAGQD